MRLSEEKQVKVKGKVFGSGKALECITIMSQNCEAAVADVKKLMEYHPDIIEWRIDWYDNQANDIADAARAISPILQDTPVLVTFRQITEGGHVEAADGTRLKAIRAVCETGCVDLVDVENASGIEFIEKVKVIAKENKMKLVLSNHNFEGTPSEDEILESLKTSQALGADVAKIAVLPHGFADVITLANATYRAKKGEVDIPLITISMGEIGIISRIMNGEMGSDLTFMSIGRSSGAGQVNHQILGVEDYRAFRKILSDN